MAQLNKKEAIQKLCLDMSNYLRILFQTNSDFVPIEQELKMVENYCNVFEVIYGQEFTYCVNEESDLSGEMILPLLIQTFVENSFKHGGEEEKKIRVTVSIRKEANYLKVCIRDSGCGFPEDSLEDMNNGIFRQKQPGHQVGIANVIQRLKLVYRDDYELLFDNTDEGARVRLSIPEIREGF